MKNTNLIVSTLNENQSNCPIYALSRVLFFAELLYTCFLTNTGTPRGAKYIATKASRQSSRACEDTAELSPNTKREIAHYWEGYKWLCRVLSEWNKFPERKESRFVEESLLFLITNENISSWRLVDGIREDASFFTHTIVLSELQAQISMLLKEGKLYRENTESEHSEEILALKKSSSAHVATLTARILELEHEIKM